MTFGIHVIWTTYMTWPPGDPRGHWSPLFDFYGRLIEQGHKLNLPDPITLARARKLAKEPPKLLTPTDQQTVADTIGTMIPGSPNAIPSSVFTNVRALAGAIEENHVHLLFGPMSQEIGNVVGKIKSHTSSAVLGQPELRDRQRTWTDGYWKVFLFEESAVMPVQRYIEEHNTRKHLQPSPYSWIRPYS